MRTVAFLLLLVISSEVCAQDPHFSQYFSSSNYLNPAFVGSEGCATIRTAYRNQWPAISGNFQTANVSFDQMIDSIHGIGLNYVYDHSGSALESHHLSLIYSPAFRLFKGRVMISPAVEIGWQGNYLDVDELTFGNMIDPRYGFVYDRNPAAFNTEKHFFDANLGLILSHHGLTYGASFQHITQPNEGFAGSSKLPIKYTAHASYLIDLHPSVQFSPAIIFLQQQDFNQFLPSLTVKWTRLRAGVAFRTSISNPDAVIFMLGYRGKYLQAGYSYDLTVSSLTNQTGGSHEISVVCFIDYRNHSRFAKLKPQIAF